MAFRQGGSVDTIRREIARGNLAAIKVGKSVRITPEAFEDYERRNQIVAA